MESRKSFSPERRLRRKSEFAELRRRGKKWVGRHWLVFYAPNELPQGRMAVSISSRHANAVGRNRFKRRLRELFRKHPNRVVGWDLHFVARQKPVQDQTKRYRQEFHEDFDRFCQRLPKAVPMDSSPGTD